MLTQQRDVAVPVRLVDFGESSTALVEEHTVIVEPRKNFPPTMCVQELRQPVCTLSGQKLGGKSGAPGPSKIEPTGARTSPTMIFPP